MSSLSKEFFLAEPEEHTSPLTIKRRSARPDADDPSGTLDVTAVVHVPPGVHGDFEVTFDLGVPQTGMPPDPMGPAQAAAGAYLSMIGAPQPNTVTPGSLSYEELLFQAARNFYGTVTAAFTGFAGAPAPQSPLPPIGSKPQYVSLPDYPTLTVLVNALIDAAWDAYTNANLASTQFGHHGFEASLKLYRDVKRALDSVR